MSGRHHLKKQLNLFSKVSFNDWLNVYILLFSLSRKLFNTTRQENFIPEIKQSLVHLPTKFVTMQNIMLILFTQF